MNEKRNVLLIGGDARGHALAKTLARSKPRPEIFAWMKARNPGIAELSNKVLISPDCMDAVAFAKECGAGLAIIGPEDPLSHGLADALKARGIFTIGPTREMARIETSKAFARRLLDNGISIANPKFMAFETMDGIKACLEKCSRKNMPVVLKPDGLTGGKGVMVQGEHFDTVAEALEICRKIFLAKHPAVVVEEKLVGVEFTLQCFCDGQENVAFMPPVQDYKRRLEGNRGSNTGSMGSYSDANHLLPFLTKNELFLATDIAQRIVVGLHRKTGKFYQGILYVSFMVTAGGRIKVIECNARFGDPEAINDLALLDTDFLDICWAIVTGTLDDISIKFKPLATVVKYVVPFNYGLPKDQQIAAESDLIQIGDLGQATPYYSSVHMDDVGRLHLTSSRAVAVLGMAPDLDEAEKIAEQGACAITGAVAHRSDIGTAALIAKSVRHMEELRKLQPSH